MYIYICKQRRCDWKLEVTSDFSARDKEQRALLGITSAIPIAVTDHSLKLDELFTRITTNYVRKNGHYSPRSRQKLPTRAQIISIRMVAVQKPVLGRPIQTQRINQRRHLCVEMQTENHSNISAVPLLKYRAIVERQRKTMPLSISPNLHAKNSQ